MAGLILRAGGTSLRLGLSPTGGVLLGVVLLHGAGLWALQSGLLMRAVQAVVAVEVISELVEPPRPKAAVHTPMAAPPKVMPKAAPVPVQAVAPAQPLAVAETMPSPNAPTGTSQLQSAAVPRAVAPAVVAPPAAAPSVELPSSDADYLHNPSPVYPRLSKQRSEQGRVLISVYIGADGSALKAAIKTSSGFERLDQAALATVMAWRYVPGKRAGVPEAMWFSVPINFVLE